MNGHPQITAHSPQQMKDPPAMNLETSEPAPLGPPSALLLSARACSQGMGWEGGFERKIRDRSALFLRWQPLSAPSRRGGAGRALAVLALRIASANVRSQAIGSSDHAATRGGSDSRATGRSFSPSGSALGRTVHENHKEREWRAQPCERRTAEKRREAERGVCRR
jgi:hypothetical protein